MKNSVDQFKKMILNAGPTEYITVASIICSTLNECGIDIVDGYTRSDFKRAVKALRASQVYAPQYTQDYESAIEHIRRVWMRRGAAV